MGNVKQYVKHFPLKNDSAVTMVGYDNFKYVKPWKAFRAQDCCTLHFVQSGAGVLKIYDKTFNVKKGGIFFIPQNEKVCYYPDENTPWEYTWFCIKNQQGNEYGRLMGFSKETPVIYNERFFQIDAILNNLKENCNKNEDAYYQTLSAFFGIMEICTAKAKQNTIEIAKNYVDLTKFMPDFSVESVCANTGISHAHLLRLFKKKYNTTIVHYVITERIQRAKELLKTTDMPIQSVGYSCGFIDEIHFMKTFKNKVGVTAGEYRNS